MMKVGDGVAVDIILVDHLNDYGWSSELGREGECIEAVILALLQHGSLVITGIEKALLKSLGLILGAPVLPGLHKVSICALA